MNVKLHLRYPVQKRSVRCPGNLEYRISPSERGQRMLPRETENIVEIQKKSK